MKNNIFKLSKLSLIIALIMALAIVGTALAAPSLDVDCEKNPDNPNCQEDKMVTICHAAGLSGTTKFVTLTISWQAAYGQAGHFNENGTPQAGHEDDYFGKCDSEETVYVEICWEDKSLIVPQDDLEDYPGYEEGICSPPPPEPGEVVICWERRNITVSEDDLSQYPGYQEGSCPSRKVRPAEEVCEKCGPHIDEEEVCKSSRVAINFHPSYKTDGGNESHLWSFVGSFEIMLLSTEELITAEEHSTPMGTVWVINIDTTNFRVFVNGEQILDSCKNLPCSTSGWSYVKNNSLLVYGPYSQLELAEWFLNDPLFNVDDWTIAAEWANYAAESLEDEAPFDLTPLLLAP